MQAKCVLIVDDAAGDRDIYATKLRHDGYEVLLAEDGETAVEICRTHEPDVILMDLALPDVDGYEARSRIWGDGLDVDVPIIAITAHVHNYDEADALERGFTQFLTKPIEPSRVAEEIERLLQPPAADT